jgi:hypothetical protein
MPEIVLNLKQHFLENKPYHLKTKSLLLFLIVLFAGHFTHSQTATIKGVILDETNQPIPGVNVTYGSTGVLSDFGGAYVLEIPANQSVRITFSHIGFESAFLTVTLELN